MIYFSFELKVSRVYQTEPNSKKFGEIFAYEFDVLTMSLFSTRFKGIITLNLTLFLNLTEF